MTEPSDLISRHMAINAIRNMFEECDVSYCGECRVTFPGRDCEKVLEGLPSAHQWHVIKKRPMTNDERIEWSERLGYDIEYEDAFIYSNLPDDGEEVLVSSQYHNVYVDKFCQDE